MISFEGSSGGNFSWAAKKINQMQNNELLPFTNYNTALTANIDSNLSDWLHLADSIDYNHFQSEQKSGNLIRTSQSKVDQIQQKLVLDFQASSKFDFSITGEQLYSRQSFYTTSNVYFIDFLFMYKSSKYRDDIEAGGKTSPMLSSFPPRWLMQIPPLPIDMLSVDEWLCLNYHLAFNKRSMITKSPFSSIKIKCYAHNSLRVISVKQTS